MSFRLFPKISSENQFRDREEAGELLALELLKRFPDRTSNRDHLIILALPRGGVPIGARVSQALGAPLDVLIVRKIGAPFNEELAVGSMAPGGVQYINQDLLAGLGFDMGDLQETILRERREMQRREELYRGDRQQTVRAEVKGKTVILMDDGLATGATMKAAIMCLREMGPAGIIVAVPLAEQQICREIEHMVDEVICLRMPHPLYGIGLWYANFQQVSDDEVLKLLHAGRTP